MMHNGVLLPYQVRWNRDKSPVKFMEKSRRIGISYGDACESTMLAGTRMPHGMQSYYLSYNKEMTETYIKDVAGWATRLQGVAKASDIEEVILEDEKDILAYRVRFASGYHVTALSSKPKNLRSKQGRIIIDEAAFCEDLDELLKAAIALIMWGGQVEIISTHNGDDNPFAEYVRDIRAGKHPYSLHRVTLDDALEEGLYQRICQVQGIPWTLEAQGAWRQGLIDFYGSSADEELFCIPAQSGGAYLTRALIESCMSREIPVIRWTAPKSFAEMSESDRSAAVLDWCVENLDPRLAALDPTGRCYAGEDFGRSGDLTVLLPLQEGADLVYRAPFALELRDMPFRAQEQIVFHVLDRLPRFSGACFDARGNGQYLAEVAAERYGAWRVSQVMLSQQWYLENMARYKAAFEDRSIVLPADADILEDHRALRVERGIPKLPDGYKGRGRDGGQRHGDSAVAGCMAVCATRMEGGPIEFAGTGMMRAATDMRGF